MPTISGAKCGWNGSSRICALATSIALAGCRETRQPVDLQLYVDDVTLARIWSNVLRFQCPHCGTKHETEVQRLASKPFSNLVKRKAGGAGTRDKWRPGSSG